MCTVLVRKFPGLIRCYISPLLIVLHGGMWAGVALPLALPLSEGARQLGEPLAGVGTRAACYLG